MLLRYLLSRAPVQLHWCLLSMIHVITLFLQRGNICIRQNTPNPALVRGPPTFTQRRHPATVATGLVKKTPSEWIQKGVMPFCSHRALALVCALVWEAVLYQPQTPLYGSTSTSSTSSRLPLWFVTFVDLLCVAAVRCKLPLGLIARVPYMRLIEGLTRSSLG